MANRQIKLSPLSQENGNLVDENLSKNRRFRNIIRDNKGNETSILQTAESISLLASSVSEIDSRVTSNTAQLVIQAGQIATKVEQSTFDTLSGRVSTAESNITQNANQIQLGVKSSSNTRDSVVPYNQFDWEQGGISISTGLSFADSTILRTIGFHSVKPSTQYVLECSNTLDLNSTIVFWYNGTTFLSAVRFNPNGRIVTSPSNATNCRVRTTKSAGGTFLLSEMPNHFVRVSPNATLQELTNYSTITQTANDITLAVSTSSNGTDSVVPYDISRWEQGAYDSSNGGALVLSTSIRSKSTLKFPVLPNTEYLLQCSLGLEGTQTRIFFYDSSDVYLGFYAFENRERKITTFATASYCKVHARKVGLATITISEMPNHWVRVVPVGKYLKGSKFEINGEKIISQADGIEFRDSGGNLRVYFDTVNNRYVFNGEIIALSGIIADFSLIPDYSTVVAGTTGRAITAGSGVNRVGMSTGVTTGGFTYVFWAGNDNPINAPFRVLRNGGLRSSNAIIGGSSTIGGWSITDTAISKGNVSLSASGTNGVLNINGVTFASSVANLVTITGSVAVVGALTFQGNMTTREVRPESTNTYACGTSSFRWASVWVNGAVLNGSDRRLKDEIKEIDQAKDFVLNLKPVQYKMRHGTSGRLHYGFIAQEVKEAMTLSGIKDAGVFVDPTVNETDLDENGRMMALRYDEFIAPMVATIQEQERRIKRLEEVIYEKG